MNTEQTVHILKILMQGPASRVDIANKTGVAPKAVGRFLAEMKAQKLVYVVAYSNQTDGRNRVKIYTFGEGEDAQPKRTQEQRDRSRRSYLKKLKAKNVFASMAKPKQTQPTQDRSHLKKLKAQVTFVPKTKFVGGKSIWQ